MKLTPEQRRSFEEASKVLIKWMNDNCHPHTKVIVEQDRAELVEGVNSFPTTEFLKD